MPPGPRTPTAAKPPHRDPVREVFETVVFVVALVLMLKLFAVEAFVIPTGSMAETLYGYKYLLTCDECRRPFPVNAANEASPRMGNPLRPDHATCPNCRYPQPVKSLRDGGPDYGSGDRVLVHKGMYAVDSGPTRGDVVVFKYPVDPEIHYEAQNYIKRLWGLGGETVAIWRGDLYVTTALDYPDAERYADGRPKYPRPADPLKLWEGRTPTSDTRVPKYQTQHNDFTYHNAEAALELFEKSRKAGFPAGAGGFEPVRKTDAQALAMRRVVYDNDHQSAKLLKAKVPPRWAADGGGWAADGPTAFAHTGGDLSFVRYRHLVGEPGDWERLAAGPDGLFAPAPVTNTLGYNSGNEAGRSQGGHWVGDLMLEATATVSGPGDTVVLELSRGPHRYRAAFAGGEVALSRVGPHPLELGKRPTPITSGGRYRLRFANVDSSLRVWVNGSAVELGAAGDYPPADAEPADDLPAALAGGAFAVRDDGHTLQNDILSPASVGASGAVRVGELRLWADTYFTRTTDSGFDDPSDEPHTFYVQPGHYLCLGDNSAASSDGRTWGLVPERLMLGKACFVFFPFFGDRFGFIR